MRKLSIFFLVICLVIRGLYLFGPQPSNLVSLGQFIALPLVIVLAAQIFCIRRFYVLLLLLLGGILTGFHFLRPSLSSHVLVSRAYDGALEVKTRVLIDDLSEAEVGLEGVPLIASLTQIPDSASGQRVLKDNPNIPALIVEQEKLLVILMAEKPSLKVDKLIGPDSELSFILPRRSALRQLEVVTSVPLFAVTRRPTAESARFVKLMLIALNEPNLELRRRAIIRAIAIDGEWKGLAHRSFALWLLGTIHLEHLLRGATLEEGELKCAVEYLSKALPLLRVGDNPQLKAAVLNNLSIAQFIRAIIERGEGLRKIAIRGLVNAESVTNEVDLYGIGPSNQGVIERNLRVVSKGSRR